MAYLATQEYWSSVLCTAGSTQNQYEAHNSSRQRDWKELCPPSPLLADWRQSVLSILCIIFISSPKIGDKLRQKELHRFEETRHSCGKSYNYVSTSLSGRLLSSPWAAQIPHKWKIGFFGGINQI